MKTVRIILTFLRFSDAQLESFARGVYASMFNNPNFISPTPTLDVLMAAIVAFSDALTATADGSRTKIAIKNKSRKALETVLKQLSRYVSMIAGDDKSIVLSGGFQTQKEGEPSPAPVAPLIEVVAGVNPGEAEIRITRIKGAQSYNYEYTPDPVTENSVWLSEPDSRIEHLVTGLPSGKRYAFRASIIGLRGARAYSAVVFLYIQ